MNEAAALESGREAESAESRWRIFAQDTPQTPQAQQHKV